MGQRSVYDPHDPWAFRNTWTGEIRNSYEDLWIWVTLIVGLTALALCVLVPILIRIYCWECFRNSVSLANQYYLRVVWVLRSTSFRLLYNLVGTTRTIQKTETSNLSAPFRRRVSSTTSSRPGSFSSTASVLPEKFLPTK
ncbi:hypothetical protein Q1695_012863 [Nippostrongylus brasiliensis]|nr:hypothetical protein Q1695_012863 [Nippostrongylus brasiliensis]